MMRKANYHCVALVCVGHVAMDMRRARAPGEDVEEDAHRGHAGLRHALHPEGHEVQQLVVELRVDGTVHRGGGGVGGHVGHDAGSNYDIDVSFFAPKCLSGDKKK